MPAFEWVHVQLHQQKGIIVYHHRLFATVPSEGMAMPESLSHITTESQWRSLVLKSSENTGMCTCRRKTAGGRDPARYLGRYLKKPPIAASRLAHYNGGASLSFRYLDHKTGETATETLTQRELVARLKQHIQEKFFKMVRYFGFLANRVCGEKLPAGVPCTGDG
ncbi:transposase [Klebsiella pneumoniae]|uniref:transposase n=1 Tax=Klebsiella pneumoniae TaxID=573 RepID=UPI003AACD085